MTRWLATAVVCLVAVGGSGCRAIGAPDPEDVQAPTSSTPGSAKRGSPRPTTTKPPATTTTTVPNASVDGSIRLELVRPRREAGVSGNSVTLEVKLDGAAVGPAAADPATADPNNKTLHFHVFVDREPVPTGQPIPRNDPSVIHFAKTPPTVSGLSVGKHRLIVVLGDAADRRATRALVESAVDVKGPAVTASAPRTVAKDQPIPVDIQYGGGAFGMGRDVPAGSFHIEAVVAEDPPRPGETVKGAVVKTLERRVNLPAMAPGTHKVWFVVTDDKSVAAKPFAGAAITVRVLSD